MENSSCNYCTENKTILFFDKIATENRLLNLIVEKNNIILKQDKLILELFDELKLTNASFITIDAFRKKIFDRFD